MNPFGLDCSVVQEIEKQFAEVQKIAYRREKELFGVFADVQNAEEELALKFLYAYMPLNDLADYDGLLFLQHVRRALKARQEVPWGSKVPGELFVWFVLPYRMSNEAIEDYRGFFFDELIDRVKDKSMYDAILEINHWCHEKATYTSTDPRTASPLTVVRTALGRCGEESALLVAALRSLCIPARQCYTPRWAHTDDNHAWVEAWADESWYFLGACEPEPRLNMGWFAGPARRAMLVSAKIPGCYRGPEERVLSYDGFLSINLLSNYAPTRRITVAVKDQNGNPVSGARVDFNVFNSGCFSPITRLATDSRGEVTLTTGFGDLLIFASTDNGFGYEKISSVGSDRVEITLGPELPEDLEVELELTPPPDNYVAGDDVSDQERQAHNERLKEEDRIRAQYEQTFVSEEDAKALAAELGLPSDAVCSVIKKARGNSHEIVAYLRESVPQYGEWALKLLQVISAKDLTDTTREVLLDHLDASLAFKNDFDPEVFADCVLNPRVSLEVLRPYRRFFQAQFSSEQQRRFRKNPEALVDWVVENVECAPAGLVAGCATPRGTYELGIGGHESRKVLFVALARSFGIPARLNRADRRAQYLTDQGWVDASIGPASEQKAKSESGSSGTLRLRLMNDYSEKPEYFRNFTIARFEGYSPHVLDFRGLDYDRFSEPFSLPVGYYWLTTGNRLSDGTVLARIVSFRVSSGDTTEVDLKIRKEEEQPEQLGFVPAGLAITCLDGASERLDDLLSPRGAVLAFIEPNREPSKHLLRELGELKDEFDRCGVQIRLFISEGRLTQSFRESDYARLPKSARFCMDRGDTVLSRAVAGLSTRPPAGLPLVILAGPDRVVRYVSAGYRIGTAADILKVLRRFASA